MAARAISSGTISFGLVSIPIKLYTAASSGGIAFNFLHNRCGSRMKQQQLCPVCDEVVQRSDLVRGYEFAKNEYVRFENDELKTLEEETSKVIELEEFVPLEKVDPVYFEKTYYLGPDKGGDKAYRLLADAMTESNRVGLAKYVMRGKEGLVLIRAVQSGLMLHTMYYADEVRDFDDIDRGQTVKLKDGEMGLALRLIDELVSKEFHPENYHDEYRDRVLRLVEQKVEGKEVTALEPQVRQSQVVDLMEALKASLERRDGAAKAKAPRAAKSAAASAPEGGDEPRSKGEPRSRVELRGVPGGGGRIRPGGGCCRAQAQLQRSDLPQEAQEAGPGRHPRQGRESPQGPGGDPVRSRAVRKRTEEAQGRPHPPHRLGTGNATSRADPPVALGIPTCEGRPQARGTG